MRKCLELELPQQSSLRTQHAYLCVRDFNALKKKLYID